MKTLKPPIARVTYITVVADDAIVDGFAKSNMGPMSLEEAIARVRSYHSVVRVLENGQIVSHFDWVFAAKEEKEGLLSEIPEP